MTGRRLQVRGTLESDYKDVFTPEAIAALEALAGLDADRKTVMAARIERRAARARDKKRITFLDPAVQHPAHPHQGAGGPGRRVRRQRHSGGPAAPVDSGHRSGRQAQRQRRGQHSQRRVRAAVRRRRLDVRRRGRARPGVDDVARQPAEPEARDPSRPRVHDRRRTGRRRDERMGAASSSGGRSSTTGARSSTSRRRCSARAAFTSTIGTCATRAAPASRPPSSTPRSTSSTTTSSSRGATASLALYLPKIQTAEEAALWNDILSALEEHLGLAVGAIKVYVLVEQLEACFQLMEIRAALGDAFRRLQHRPLGLHQQRRRRDGVGSGIRQPQHRRHHDDLRLHAELRGPRAPRRATRPTSSASSRSGRAGWSRTSRSVRRAGVDSRHEAGGGRRRARAARGRERQVGRALEDGAHRPAGLGESRSGQSARTEVPAAHLHAGRRGWPHAARTGAAHRSRRPRSR